MQFSSSSSRPMLSGVPVAMLGIAALAGCQSYQPKPLALSEHREAFLARTPEAPEVAAFAASLAAPADQASADFNLLDGVSLSEAEAVALVFNADLRVSRLRAGVALAGAENAGLWEDPSIGVDITRIIQSVQHPWKLAASVGFTLPVSGRLRIEKAKAGSEHAAELARVQEQEWEVRVSLRRAWSRWSAADAQARTTLEFLGRVDQVLSIVDAMERAGEIARTEARLFRIERATTSDDLLRLESQAAESVLEIKRLMGLSPGSSITLLHGAFPLPSDEPDDFAGSIHESNLSLAAARAGYEVAERALELEVRKQYPDLTLAPGYGRDDGNDELLLGIALPLPVLNANRRGIAEAHAAREAARGAAEALLESLLNELAGAELQLSVARARRAALETDLVPLVDAQYADAREVARLGEVNTLVLLETLSRQHEAKLRLIEAFEAESLAAIRHRELLGPARPAGNGQGPAPAISAGDQP